STPSALRVPEAELDTAAKRLSADVGSGLEHAITNVMRGAEAWLGTAREVNFGGHEVRLREVPVRRAAVYVPGGRAPYPSTVVMGVATARAAGVETVVVCSPPGRDGTVNPV